MLPKLHIIVCFCFVFLCLSANHCKAQCTNRYIDTTTFSAVDIFPNIIYTTTAGGATDTLLLDVYQPHGDTACIRHLAIWVHGGAFFQGTKNDGDIEFLCNKFSKRGYVCAGINYRLTAGIYDLYDSAQIFKYAYEAFADLKAAIRYFYKDASQTNHWNIDTTSIFIGGSSAGGIAVDFAATLNNPSQIAAAFQSIVTANGGIEGNSGNAGYSTKVTAVASLAGAVNTVDWIEANDPPIVMCQGTADGTVPYDCGLALTQYTFGLYPTIDFCGSGAMKPVFDSLGVVNSLLAFQGSGHVPWDTNTTIANRMDSAVASFFYQIKCTQASGNCNEPSGITYITKQTAISISPNPAKNFVEIKALGEGELTRVLLYDYTGKLVLQSNNVAKKEDTFSVNGLSSGMYILYTYTNNKSTLPVISKLIIE